MDAPRFSEPREDNFWRITCTYRLGPVVFLKARGWDEIVDFEEVDKETVWIDYEIEWLTDSEPEIVTLRVMSISAKGKEVPVSATPYYIECCKNFLIKDNGRFDGLKDFAREFGQRDYRRNARAA